MVVQARNVGIKMLAEGLGIGRAPYLPGAAGGQQFAHEVGDFVHQAQVVVACAVPFEQHEFAPVLASLLLTAKYVRQLVNIACAK